MVSRAKKPATPAIPSQKQVTSDTINDLIKERAPSSDNWAAVQALIKSELGVTISLHAVQDRGRRHGVRTRNIRTPRPSATYAVNNEVPAPDPMAQRVLDIIKRRKSVPTVEDLANLCDTSPANVRQALKLLHDGGHNVIVAASGIELGRDIPKADPFRIDISKTRGKVFRFGVTADNHLASRYARLDVLNCLYDVWEAEGVTTVYQCGNMIEGDASFNKHEVYCHGLERQGQYFVENWPQRKGVSTHFITGDDHEGWYTQREGVDVGRYLEGQAKIAGRNDLQFLGHMEHDIEFEGKFQTSILRLIHAGGGSAYAHSYRTQKIVESYQGGEKPNVLLVGHYHKVNYGYAREVHTLQVGCTCDQTSFMRKKSIEAHVGACTVEMTVSEDGVVTRFKQEWMPFYDRGFYDKVRRGKRRVWRQQFID